MEINFAHNHQWKEIKQIYMEAFPKSERKPFFIIKHSVKKGKVKILTAIENGILQGFAMIIPYKNMVMLDYLAVSNKIRSHGTGSKIMNEICKKCSNKKIVLLIECIDDKAKNNQQRIARKNFYIKNGFSSSNIFINGVSGNMEILNKGEKVSPKEYMELQKYALGKLLFKLSKITLIKPF